MLTDSIKYSSQKQLKEFFGFVSSEELNNLCDFIEGKTKVCDNPKIEECPNDGCIITNYVGGAINITRGDLRKYLETYIRYKVINAKSCLAQSACALYTSDSLHGNLTTN